MPCIAALTGFDASTVDVLVAIAAAAIASGSVELAGDAGAATISVAATGAAITAATAAGVALVATAACADAAGSADVVESVAGMMSASLAAAFTIPVFADPGFTGLQTAPASAFEPAAAACTTLGSSSCEGVFAAAFEEDAGSRGCRPSEVVDGSSGRCDGRSDAVGVARSLPDVSAALLSISAEKLSDAGDWSAFADLDGAF